MLIRPALGSKTSASTLIGRQPNANVAVAPPGAPACGRGQSGAEPIALELAESIYAGRIDPRLKWQGEGTVPILMAKVFLYDCVQAQTPSEVGT